MILKLLVINNPYSKNLPDSSVIYKTIRRNTIKKISISGSTDICMRK